VAGEPIANPMRIALSEERRDQLVEALQRFQVDEFDQELSDFQARRLLAFFIHHLGAPIYNQAIQDARGFLQDKLSDLEGEFYEPEASES
jgi:uncharacterized protein (DUF2164 family)